MPISIIANRLEVPTSNGPDSLEDLAPLFFYLNLSR